MKKYFAAAAAVLVTSFALTAAPAFSQAMPAVDPAAAAAVKEMLVAMNYREVMATSFQQAAQNLPATMRSMANTLAARDTKLSAADKAKRMEAFEKAIPGVLSSFNEMMSDPALFDEVIAEMVPLYANTYSVAEIRQLTAFYQSPVGQKMLVSMPRLMNESLAISNRIMGPRVGKIMEQTMRANAQ
jgi:hypothetical protein